MIDFSKHATPEYYRETINKTVSEIQNVNLLWIVCQDAARFLADEKRWRSGLDKNKNILR